MCVYIDICMCTYVCIHVYTYITHLQASVITKLASKVDSLAVLIHKSSRAGTRQALAHKLAQIQALPIYSETEEVAKILTEMLSDIAGQVCVCARACVRACVCACVRARCVRC